MASVIHVQDIDAVVGQYGEAIAFQANDSAGAAYDLSAYTVAVLRAISYDALTTREITAAITSSTGGTFTVTPDSTNYFDVAGDWDAQMKFSDTGVLALSYPFTINVKKQI